MDTRKALPQGTVLHFGGILCEIGQEIGRGSNAIVYQGSYRDALAQDQTHRVLVKELFPLHPQGKIFRQADGFIRVEPEGEQTFLLHRHSFEAGNKAHLALLETCPDQIGANLNTYPLNGTLYTLLGVSGGESLEKRLRASLPSLRTCAMRMLAILDALEIFHKNGLAHLDIAPDNILLLGSGNRERALLIDYNSVMAVELARWTQDKAFSVKPGYTAPEIRSGRVKDISFASDLYSVTAVFFRLLTGTALTNFQMIRAAPPDVSDCPAVKDEPETVKIWVQEILKRGLQTVPARRYQDTAAMRQDLEELIDRIDGVGITHWALWEAGRRQVERMVRENPSLSFLRDSAKLFPTMVSDGQAVYPAEEYLRNQQGSCLLLAGGGMGKTTALLHLAFSGDVRYAPIHPAVLYLSLYGWQAGDGTYIVNSLLDGLLFRPDTHTYEDARKVLYEVLDQPVETKAGPGPVLLLLLDGYNEITGDPKALLDELKRLAALRGVRIVLTSRTEEESLPFARLHMTELSEEAVRNALSAEGLLLPESPVMRQLLRTPLMLSMYIRSAQVEARQLRIETSEELLRTYLNALKEKAIRDLPDQADRRWQIEAAVDLALPAYAAELHKRRRAMRDRELLPVAENCYRILNGPLSRRFFPQWIGRKAAIRGGAKNAEEWYGQVTHHILWKQLGLIMRDESGQYAVSHQVIEEYLLTLDKENRQRLRRYQRTRALLICVCVALVIPLGFHVYKAYIAPPPYEEAYADNVMTRALDAYVNAGRQYETLADLNDCARQTPEDFDTAYLRYQNDLSYASLSKEMALEYLGRMLETGQVMPWSNRPMDEEACKKLMALSADRAEEYRLFADVLHFVMTNAFAKKHYGEEYPKLLSEFLEADADIAADLYLIVCQPHITGKYADQSITAEGYRNLLATVIRQNEHQNSPNVGGTQESLVKNESRQRICLEKLYQCGAFAAYESYAAQNTSK